MRTFEQKLSQIDRNEGLSEKDCEFLYFEWLKLDEVDDKIFYLFEIVRKLTVAEVQLSENNPDCIRNIQYLGNILENCRVDVRFIIYAIGIHGLKAFSSVILTYTEGIKRKLNLTF